MEVSNLPEYIIISLQILWAKINVTLGLVRGLRAGGRKACTLGLWGGEVAVGRPVTLGLWSGVMRDKQRNRFKTVRQMGRQVEEIRALKNGNLEIDDECGGN